MTNELKSQLTEEITEEIARLDLECAAAWNEVIKADEDMAPLKKVSAQATKKWADLHGKLEALKSLV